MSLALTSRRAALLPGRWVSNELWRRARAVPSLDLRFAENKSLVDSVSGQNLITFTRASTGTYVDSDGVIRSAATNLALNSATFQPTSGAAPAAYTVDQVAPDGTTTGSRQTNASPRTLVDYTGIANGTYTFSFYCRVVSGTATFSIQLKDAATDTVRATDASPVATTTWRRYTITGTTSGATPGVRIEVTGVVAGFVFWGAQLEVGSTATPYIPTGATINSAPRFDHNPLTGECLGLLVEEQRQNLLTFSEEIQNAAWSTSASSVTSNATTAPNGALTADKVVEDLANSAHGVFRYPTVTSNGTVTGSVFLKKAERQYIRLSIGDAFGANSVTARINLDDGTVATVTGGSNPPISVSASLIAYPNGWYRVTVTATLTGSSTNGFLGFNSVTSGWAGYTGDGTSGFFAWGAQLEAGAFPTSYIPTTGTAATRTADVASISGTNFSSWYRQDAGTFYVDAIPVTSSAVSAIVLGASNGTSTNRHAITRNSSTNIARIFVNVGGVIQTQTDLDTWVGRGKVAYGYATNDFAGSLNGAPPAVDTVGTLPTVSDLFIGRRSDVATNPINGTLSRIAYFDQRLPDATLQSVTL